MKVIVAIPHYNSLDTLWRLITQLREDSFDQIIVLDDCSDVKPNKLEAEFPAVTFHYGSQNVGIAANRNRILKLVDEGIIWFVDTDMEIVSIKNADRLRSIFGKDQLQMVGGLIYTKSGQEMEWNYGHEMHPVHDARFEELAKGLKSGDTSAWSRLQAYRWDYSWLQPGLGHAALRTVDWVAEGSFAITAELFHQLGGYDTAFHYHEGQDLARRVRSIGAKIQVTPDLITRHLEAKVRSDKERAADVKQSQYLFFQKHWGLSRELYEELYK